MIVRFGKKQVYPFVALLFSILDILNMVQAGECAPGYVLLHCITVVAVASIPWSPRFSALLALLSCVMLLLFPFSFVGGSIMAGLSIVVIADVISRGWWTHSVLYLIIIAGGYIYSPQYDTVPESVLSLILVLFIASVIGLLMYSYQKQIVAVGLMHEKELGELRLGVAQRLHDSVATDLTKALLVSRSLSSQSDSSYSVSDVQIIESNIKNALNELRSVATVLSSDSGIEDIGVNDLLNEERRIMLLAGQKLVTHGNFDDDDIQSAIGPLFYRLFLKFMREGLMNCHKYAAKDSTIRAWTSNEGGVFQAVVVSEIDLSPRSSATSELTSGMGLDILVREARALGGTVTALSANDQWVLMLEIPLKELPQKDTHQAL